MPLRQTCDRCRYLKVRCEKNSPSPSARCVRCAKAGALCVHNRKYFCSHFVFFLGPPFSKVVIPDTVTGRQRSGRPTANNSPHHGSREPRPGSGLSLDFSNNGLSQPMCPDMTSNGSLGPSHDASWPNARSMVSFEAINQFMEYEDTSNTLPFDSCVDSQHGLNFLTNGLMSDQSPTPEDASTSRDGVERNIKELTELSIRAYRTIAVARTPPTDELSEMTQSVLRVLARVTEMVKQPQGRVPGDGDQDRSPFPHRGPSASVSLVLQVVSVCEQIYNAFVHACSVLHGDLEPHTQPGSGSKENEHSMTNAQAVMTVELINYLFEKLSRGQRQLLAAALTAEDASPSSPACLSPGGSVMTPSTLSDSSSGCSMSVISIMMLRANGKHPELQTYIQTIRDLTRKNDCI